MDKSNLDLINDALTNELFEKIKEIALESIDEESIDAKNILTSDIIPDKMRFAKLKEFMDSNNIDFSKKMIIHYINEGLLPEPEKPSPNQSIYGKEHVYLFLVIDKLKKHLKIEEIKPLMEVINLSLEEDRDEAKDIAEDFFSYLDESYRKYLDMTVKAHIPYLRNRYKENIEESNNYENSTYFEEEFNEELDLLIEYYIIRDLILLNSAMAIAVFSVINPLVDLFKDLKPKFGSLFNQE